VPTTSIASAHPPSGAQQGTKVIGTVLTGVYSNSDAYANVTATSPTITLTNATEPILHFYMWVDTEGSTYDGANLRVSQDGGPFNLVGSGNSCTAANMCTPVGASKSYNSTLIGSQPAWGGYENTQGWQEITVNLSSFVGHDVKLRFSFRSDGSGQYSGVYIDNVSVAEANTVPITITTMSLPTGYVGFPYAATLSKIGGSSTAVWSLQPGGTNDSWVTISPSGQLGGTPAAGNVGTTTLKIHVQEPSLPSNFDDQTLTFSVGTAFYNQSFEGACPNGWTLTGDWQCGVPNYSAGPAAYDGSKCLATQLQGDYSPSQAWATTTATSPSFSLTGATTPKLQFQAWVDTEGFTYDGFNVLVSNNGGMSFTQLLGVTPAYGLTIGGKQAWGGDPTTPIWAPYQADLSAYVGQNIQIRFAFQSDGSVEYPGVYIDAVKVTN